MSFRQSLSLWVCTAAASVALATTPGLASTPAYSAMFVFGDSYCDVGNIYIASQHTIPPSPPYYAGHFSNGPIWVEHLASAMGLPMLPSLAGGTDYAFGGALVTAPYVTPAGTIPSVPQQVALYLAQHGGKADPKALYVLEGGGNDILNAPAGTSPADLAFLIAQGLAQSELLLRAAGAKHFLIPNSLDVGLLPGAAANKSFATATSLAVNVDLNFLLAVEELSQTVDIRRPDVFKLFNNVQNDATHFGFTNVVTPCLNLATYQVCADPDHTLFWDAEHPTEFGQAFFAVAAEASLGK